MSSHHTHCWLAVAVLLASCGAASTRPPATAGPAIASMPVRVSTQALRPPRDCTGAFAAHALDFSTEIHGSSVSLFDSNGAGVAIGDLDEDGRPDLVFANLDGPNAIFWNQGDFAFRKDLLGDTNSRAVNLVDTDGDGLLDIVFTHRGGGVSLWRNTHTRAAHFAQAALPGVLEPAYSMAWADLNGDNALDLVTGSYDTELAQRQMNAFLWSDGAGVYAYTRDGAAFRSRRLARQAQALAIGLPDLNGDKQPDILIGNDFAMPDTAWLREHGGWVPAAPFAATSESTMSFDQGDIDNSGAFALLTTDMKPYDVGVPTLAAWLPMMAAMPQRHAPGNIQVTANVLQVRGADGRYRDEAAARGVSATGWSWSGKFGDLDNDGWLDLYVVNGMIATQLFHHLPHDELVEQNQALRNQGGGVFAPAPAWGLGATASGRGMSMADLDGDGKLDIVVNNLRAPAQVFENRLCAGAAIEVDLAWPASQNTRAIGALLTLETSVGTLTRDVRAGSGYLSGDPARVHFGFPNNAQITRLSIRWPDGAVSTLDTPAPGMRLTVTRK